MLHPEVMVPKSWYRRVGDRTFGNAHEPIPVLTVVVMALIIAVLTRLAVYAVCFIALDPPVPVALKSATSPAATSPTSLSTSDVGTWTQWEGRGGTGVIETDSRWSSHLTFSPALVPICTVPARNDTRLCTPTEIAAARLAAAQRASTP